jgi:hypothetical protein
MRSLSTKIALLALTAAFGLARAAQASPSYPEEIEAALGMSCPPPCTICHDTQAGGVGTARTKFAAAMIDKGLTKQDPARIRPALDALEAAGASPDAGPGGVDSDGDGVGDVEELRQDRDPNGPGLVCGPRYGCGARVEPRGHTDATALAAASAIAAALLVLGRRRRRR